jgi:hypothetical protein
MRHLLVALSLLLAVTAPARAQDGAFDVVVTMRPFVDMFRPEQWAPVGDAMLQDGGLGRIFEEQGLRIAPWTVHAAIVDLIAGGSPELLVSFRQGCGNSGCWTYVLEVQNDTLRVIANTVLPDAFRLWRNAGETRSTIAGYRHGLYWNGRDWVQFCTDTQYCG